MDRNFNGVGAKILTVSQLRRYEAVGPNASTPRETSMVVQCGSCSF